MENREHEPQESAVDRFERLAKDLVFVQDYLLLLMQVGLPAFNEEYYHPERDPKKVDRDYETAIGLTFRRVLSNRLKQGFPNDKVIDFNLISFGENKQFEEFIVDDETKRRVSKGLLLGMVSAGLIPPGYVKDDDPFGI